MKIGCDPISADTPIKKLLFWNHHKTYYGTIGYRRFGRKAIKSLKRMGIVLVCDLEGMSATEIEDLPGWDKVATIQLMKAAKLTKEKLKCPKQLK